MFCERYILKNFANFTRKHLCRSPFSNKAAEGVLKNFAKFIRKYLCQCPFWIKLQASALEISCNFIEKETLAQVLSCEFREIFKNTFFKEHFWATASESIAAWDWVHYTSGFCLVSLWSRYIRNKFAKANPANCNKFFQKLIKINRSTYNLFYFIILRLIEKCYFESFINNMWNINRFLINILCRW